MDAECGKAMIQLQLAKRRSGGKNWQGTSPLGSLSVKEREELGRHCQGNQVGKVFFRLEESGINEDGKTPEESSKDNREKSSRGNGKNIAGQPTLEVSSEREKQATIDRNR